VVSDALDLDMLGTKGVSVTEWGTYRAPDEWDYTPVRCIGASIGFGCANSDEHGHRFRRTVTAFDNGTFVGNWEELPDEG
jgi:hypothetical protein